LKDEQKMFCSTDCAEKKESEWKSRLGKAFKNDKGHTQGFSAD